MDVSPVQPYESSEHDLTTICNNNIESKNCIGEFTETQNPLGNYSTNLVEKCSTCITFFKPKEKQHEQLDSHPVNIPVQ